MKDIIGVFRREAPNKPWHRLMTQGTRKEAWAFQQMYPDYEVALFQYDGSTGRPFNQYAAERMKRIS